MLWHYLVAEGTNEQVMTFMFNAVRQHLTGKLFDKREKGE